MEKPTDKNAVKTFYSKIFPKKYSQEKVNYKIILVIYNRNFNLITYKKEILIKNKIFVNNI